MAGIGVSRQCHRVELVSPVTNLAHRDDASPLLTRTSVSSIAHLQSTTEFSVDVTGQRLVSRETGIRHGQPYDIFYLYYYPAVRTVLLQSVLSHLLRVSRKFSSVQFSSAP